MKRPRAARLFLLYVIFALPASSAVAEGLSAVINGKSIHVDASHDWNEDNLGLGFEYQFATQTSWKKQLMVNGFRDSNEEMSYMFGGGLHRTLFATDRMDNFYIDLGINAFLMTRKDINDNRPFPGVLPSLTLGNRHMGVNLTYLPKVAVERVYDRDMADDSMTGIVFLQFKVDVSRLLPERY